MIRIRVWGRNGDGKGEWAGGSVEPGRWKNDFRANVQFGCNCFLVFQFIYLFFKILKFPRRATFVFHVVLS